MSNKNINIFTAIMILFSFLITGGVFAYWASEVAGDSTAVNPQITIGEGGVATSTLNLDEAQRTQGELVPVGYEEAGKVSQIVITYEVFLEATDEAASGAIAQLVVSCTSVPNNLLNVNIISSSQTIVAGGQIVQVYVSVTLDEPADVLEYQTVAGMSFVLPLTFSAII